MLHDAEMFFLNLWCYEVKFFNSVFPKSSPSWTIALVNFVCHEIDIAAGGHNLEGQKAERVWENLLCFETEPVKKSHFVY